MFPYTYRAYWRDQGATDWNIIQSPTPITWANEITPGQSLPFPFSGGQSPGIQYKWSYEYRGGPGANWQSYTNIAQTTSPRRSVYGPVEVPGKLLVGQGSRACGIPNLASFEIDFVSSAGVPQFGGLNLGGAACRSPSFEVRNLVFTRLDNQPDTGGNPGGVGSCKTTFSTGLIIERPECIEVTLNPPECPCCSLLLPKATAILARLS